MITTIHRAILFLKYFKTKEFPGKRYLLEIHSRLYDQTIFECIYRAELLYYLLKNEGHPPTLVKISIRNNRQTELTSFKNRFEHIDGQKFHTHYAVLLNKQVYDPNISLIKPITEADYLNHAINYRPKDDILIEEVQPSQSRKRLASFYSTKLSQDTLAVLSPKA